MKYVLLLMMFASIGVQGESLSAKVVSVYDGDTFTVNVDGCPKIFCEHIPVRINGIDAPEMKGKCQKEIDKAGRAKRFLMDSIHGKTVELKEVVRDKYFRIRADVYANGVNVGDQMIKGLHARDYGGGKRVSWCEPFIDLMGKD